MSAVTADVCDVAGDRGMWRCCLDEKKKKKKCIISGRDTILAKQCGLSAHK